MLRIFLVVLLITLGTALAAPPSTTLLPQEQVEERYAVTIYPETATVLEFPGSPTLRASNPADPIYTFEVEGNRVFLRANEPSGEAVLLASVNDRLIEIVLTVSQTDDLATRRYVIPAEAEGGT